MKDLSLYNNLYNENYTDVRKNELIQKVFDNRGKSLLAQKSETFKFAEGGGVGNDEEKIYTPYEFLRELLPTVYGRDYVVSDEVGKKYEEKAEKDQIELDEYVNSKLAEYGVKSLYKIDNKTLIEEIEIRRRKLISDKSFITESELTAYLFCHPELNTEHYFKEAPIYDVDLMIRQGVVMVDYDSSNYSYLYVYVHEYLSGNLYKKLTRLRQYKDRLIESGKLTDEQFIIQENALKNNLPKQAKITLDADTCIFILPKSDFANNFRVTPEDTIDFTIYYNQSFYDCFRDWTYAEGALDLSLITKSDNLRQIHKYFTEFETYKKESYSSLDAETRKQRQEADEREYADRRTKAFIDGKRILLEFMNKGLTTNCQLRLEYEWNEKYNYYTEPKYYKIPVACQMSNKFKSGSDFTPNETQIQSIQFEKSVGSGLLAYGVGVGKTASAILNVSYALDNNLCKKPIFIVPNPTYEKWKKEMFGGMTKLYIVDYIENEKNLESSFEDEAKAKKFAKAVDGKIKEKTKKIYGHISHLNNYVDLYNLSEDYVLKIKDYTDEEKLEMKNISALLKYLKSLPKSTQLVDVQDEITLLFPLFNYERTLDLYMRERNSQFNDWWKKPKNSKSFPYYENASDYFFNNEFKLTIIDFFYKKIAIYRTELPYIKGNIKSFEKGTIFIATYDALEHLGLSWNNRGNEYELKDNDSLFGQLFKQISQGDDIENINFNTEKSLPSLWKNAIYGKVRTKVDISELDIDYTVFDESHLMKKVFTDCKGLPTYRTRNDTGSYVREDRKYSFGKGELPSTIALTGFFITRFIQSNNNGSNVIQLTATPFTNKPAEIYSMLALTNGKMLNDSGFTYMQQFFDVYMDISYELVFGNTGVTRKESLLGYRNLPQLRNLIYSIMDYKSGEDANIKRPEKLLFPSAERNVQTTLPETEIQDDLFKQIKDYQRGKISWTDVCAESEEVLDIDELTEEQLLQYVADKGTDVQKERFEEAEKPLSEDDFDSLKKIVSKLSESATTLDESQITDESEKDSFRVIRGLGTLKAVTLSPYLSTCQKEAGIEPTYTQYIESSPKLIYTLNCIKSIHDYELENNLRKSGCVIYMNMGVNVSFTKDGKDFKWSESGFKKIKQYLIQKMGYKDSEVVMVSGGMSNDDKERAKNSFLAGTSSVLIGSSTISTGVDLQDNASALFLCSFDWNPTDNEQISGRIHRQGNRFEQIRIVYPMVMNSADPNIFQQLYEKTLRIKNIWDRNDKGNTLDLRDFDVNSLRKGILDEPEDLANYWKEEKSDELQTKNKILLNRLQDLNTARNSKEIYDEYTPVMKGIIVVLDAYRKQRNKKEAEANLKLKLDEVDDKFEDVEDLEEKFAKIGKEKAKIIKESYDIKNDPDGRYRFLTYDEIPDGADLLKKINSTITNSDAIWNQIDKFTFTDKNDIRYGWLATNFPRFDKGYYNLSVPEEEDKRIFVDFSNQNPVQYANKWKGAYGSLQKLKEKLFILGIEFNDIPQAIENIKQQQIETNEELDSISAQYPQKLQQYIEMKAERRIIQPTIQQRVDEFASYNDILKKTVTTFKEDKSKVVDVPTETLPIKPAKKIKDIEQVIDEAVLDEPVIVVPPIEEVEQIDTSNLIKNLTEGMVVRFNMGSIKKGETLFVDIFYEDSEFVLYKAFENDEGEIVRESEKDISEKEVIQYYVRNNAKISEEFFEGEEDEEEVEEIIESTSSKSKSEIYQDLIAGYELAIEIETNEDKIKLYQDLIAGYELALEIEN